MGVSKNSGTQKWMVKIMENPMNKWMILGENPLFSETPIFGVYRDFRAPAQRRLAFIALNMLKSRVPSAA